MANNPSPTSPHSITSTVFSPDTLVSVTLTDGSQFDGTRQFSLGAWLLIEPGNAAGDLFSAGDHFAVSLSESGAIEGKIGTGSWIPANANVPVSRWFYLLITVDTVAQKNSASVSLYLDGALADTTTVSGTGGGTSAQFTIGGAAFQSTAVSVFNSILLPDAEQYIKPNWSLPSSWQNMIAVVDFTQNPPLDQGPSHYAVSYTGPIPCQFCNTPALYFDGAASANLTSPSAIVPSGHFSLGLWCYVGIGTTFGNQITLLQISSDDGTQTLTLSFAVGTGTVSVFVTTSCNGIAQTSPYQLPDQTWSVIGLNCDGSKIYLSVNGSVVHSTGFKGFSKPLSSLTLGSTQIHSGAQNFRGYIQSFFTTAQSLSAADLYTLLTGGMGAQNFNCLLEFAGVQILDQVTGALVELNQANMSNQLSTWQVNPGISQAVGQRIAKPSAGPVVPQKAQPWFASAKSNNPDILGYNLELYDQLVSALPDSERKTRLRQFFQQKLQEGFDRAKTGDWAVPKVQCELVHGKYRFTLSKPFVENDVYELDAAGISPCTVWTIQIAAQCICIMLQLFGFAFALAPILKTMTTTLQNLKLAQELPFYEGPTQVGAIINIINEADVSSATIVRIVQTLYSSNLLLPCIINGLAGVSWWSWAFTVSSILVSIVGIWVTGGWYLAIMLAQLAISVAQLITLVNAKPQSC
jgi:hypothetical protein